MSESIGPWLAKYLMLLMIVAMVRIAAEMAVEFEYRTGFLTQSEKMAQLQKIHKAFVFLIVFLPFIVP